MKDMILSTLILMVLIGGWLFFAHYSETKIDGFTESIQEEILPAVESDDWEKAKQKTKELNTAWHDYKKIAIYFLDTKAINDIDYSIARSVKYVKAKDLSNSSGELNSVAQQLTFLCSNDELNWGNVF